MGIADAEQIRRFFSVSARMLSNAAPRWLCSMMPIPVSPYETMFSATVWSNLFRKHGRACIEIVDPVCRHRMSASFCPGH